MASRWGQIDSGGGAVFIGDGNAGRDIVNIHLQPVRPLARSLYRSFVTSSEQFRPVQIELATLMGVLDSIVEDWSSIQVESRGPGLCRVFKDCRDILEHLQELKQHYDSVGTQARRTWKREKWRADELAEIWTRLRDTTSSLSVFHGTLIQSSLESIQKMLETFIDEFRAGKREGSVMTSHTTGSLSPEEKETWRQLRKELESVGITPDLFGQYHDLIKERLLKAFEDRDLVEIGEEFSNTTPDSTLECFDTVDSNSSYGISAKDPDEMFPGSAQESFSSPAATTGYANKTSLEVGAQKTKPPPTNPSTTRPIKRPRQLTRLLTKVVGVDRSMEVAVKAGNVKLVRDLLQIGARLDAEDKRGRTLLVQAAWDNHPAVFDLLLTTGKLDINSKDAKGFTPLHIAARNGHEAMVKRLLQTPDIDINVEWKFDLRPLHLAAYRGFEAVVKLLLETGKVDVDAMSQTGWTPLYAAAMSGHEAVIKLLLNTGKVDVNVKNKYGDTPLREAALYGHKAVIELLLETGKVDINAKYGNGWTPLHMAAMSGHEAVIKLLLNTGKFDVNAKTDHGRTPLHTADIHGKKAVVKLLREAGGA